MITNYTVLSHEHEPENGVYRVVVGRPIVHEVHVHDEDGSPVMDEVPVLDENGQQLHIAVAPEPAQPVELPKLDLPVDEDQEDPTVPENHPEVVTASLTPEAPEPELRPLTQLVHRTETAVIGHEDVEDIVFAADDKRWQGKTDAEVVAEQRKIIARALHEREQEASRALAAQPKARQMPGVGEAL